MAEIINFMPATDSRSGTDDILRSLRGCFEDDMGAVEALIEARLAGSVELIPQIGAHIIQAGGKRLRPMLTLAAAHMVGYKGAHHIALAAAVEFMHTATLLHDDVVDESDMRRGLATARRLWGNQASILVGDFLLGQAFMLMVSAHDFEALEILSRAASVIAEGEVMQLATVGRIDASEDDYMRVIEAKTATLFAAAMQVGGVVGDAPPKVIESLRSYGHNLGIAFQLIDDALDYGGSTGAMGKHIGDDFREGKITLPLVLAFRRGDESERAFWQESMTQSARDQASLDKAIGLLHKHDTLANTVERATHYGARAKDALALLPASVLRTRLTELVDFCIARAY